MAGKRKVKFAIRRRSNKKSKTVVVDPETQQQKEIPKDAITRGTKANAAQAGGSDTTLTSNPLGGGIPDGPSSSSINMSVDGPDSAPTADPGVAGTATVRLVAPTPSAQSNDQTVATIPASTVGAGGGPSRLTGDPNLGNVASPRMPPPRAYTAHEQSREQERRGTKGDDDSGVTGQPRGNKTDNTITDPYIDPGVGTGRRSGKSISRGRLGSWLSVGGVKIPSKYQTKLRNTSMGELMSMNPDLATFTKKLSEDQVYNTVMSEQKGGDGDADMRPLDERVKDMTFGQWFNKFYESGRNKLRAQGYQPTTTRKTVEHIFAGDEASGLAGWGDFGVNVAQTFANTIGEPMSAAERKARALDEPLVITEAGDTMTRKQSAVVGNNVLRPNEMELAGSGPLVTTPEQKMQQNMFFEGFSWVPPGFGLGPHNRLNNLNHQHAMIRYGMGKLSMPRAYEPYCGPHQQPPQHYESVSPAQLISDILYEKLKSQHNQMAVHQQMNRPRPQLNHQYNHQVSSQGLPRKTPAQTQPVINALRDFLPCYDSNGSKMSTLNRMRDIWQGTWGFPHADSALGNGMS